MKHATRSRLDWLARTFVLSLGFLSGAAFAAGGHHSLDDAAILEPGACEAESWLARSRGGQRLLHAGGACRVGPVELGASAEYARQAGASETAYAVQAKWATELAAGVSAGLSLASGWQAHVRPRYQGVTLVALATWAARDDVALHLNLGRDFNHAGSDENRYGVSVEWAPRENWSLTAERYAEERTHFVRAGLRWAANADWTFDVSRAHRLRGPGESTWIVGMTRAIAR
ncbi:MAG: hypothetical protein Q8R01_13195 [Ramlibacter sp.]|nr:hypothetical protein [Ramlibacter sp.]